MYLCLAEHAFTWEGMWIKETKEGLDLAVKDGQENLLSIGKVRKRKCYLLQCIEVVRIDANGRDIIRRFICQ